MFGDVDRFDFGQIRQMESLAHLLHCLGESIQRKVEKMKRRYLDAMIITIPGRENTDGTETPAVDFRCEVETLPTGKKRIRQCDEVVR